MIKLFISFSDGKIVEVQQLQEEDLDYFLSCITKNKMYWNKLTGRGFWLNSSIAYHIVAEKWTPTCEPETPSKENVPEKITEGA